MRFPGFSVYHETPFTCQVILRAQNFARSRDRSPAASTDKDKQGKGKHTFRATRLEEIKASDVRAINRFSRRRRVGSVFRPIFPLRETRVVNRYSRSRVTMAWTNDGVVNSPRNWMFLRSPVQNISNDTAKSRAFALPIRVLGKPRFLLHLLF